VLQAGRLAARLPAMPHSTRIADVTVTRVAVIIPYYQRQPGLLAKAAASIAAQHVAEGTEAEIIIVDDGSPSPASVEPLPALPNWCTLKVIVQQNRGVSAARNAGLDAVAGNTDYVAFLDSDDIWAPAHLGKAIEALANGADIYFDNSYFEENESYFEGLSFIEKVYGSIDIDKPEMFYIDGRRFYLLSLLETIPHTSQTVFRYSRYHGLRFDDRVKTAGEDRLYFAEMARGASMVACYTGIMGSRGRGVSVYRSRLGWDVAALERTVDEITCRRLLTDRLDPPAEERKVIDRSTRYFCDHFVFLAMRNLFSETAAVFGVCAALIRVYPGFLLRVPGSVLRLPSHRRLLLKTEAARLGRAPAGG
jgi:succinoglycan biosynthesis protein ExoW